MTKKVTDIKKAQPKHVDVEDQTKESHISVHKEEKRVSKKAKKPKKKSKKKASSTKSKNSQKNSPEFLENFFHTVEKELVQKPKKIESARIVFMGTGKFAGNILKELLKREECVIKEVVTQPDKKVGRKKSSIHRTLAPNPVRDIALKNNIKLYQPQKLSEETIAHMKKTRPDVVIVASYGKILPKELLKIPKYGAINVHASLLPQLRGASPVQNSILIGLKETGVTIMKMDEGLDTGDIIAQKKVAIEDYEKADDLLIRLSKVGAKLLIDVAPKLLQNKITPQPQDHSKATLCQLIDREDGHIQWMETTQEIYNRYRALYPWPGIFSYWEQRENQMIRIKLRAINPYHSELTEEQKSLQPGTVFIGRDQLCVKTSDSAIIIEAVQPECKTIMPVYDFLNGHKSFEGAVLR